MSYTCIIFVGKETKNQLDGGIEETVNDEVTNDGEQREAEVESQKDETNTKPSFHERLQQIKAARVEEIKDKEEVKKDSRMSSRIDEEEVLKEKAKRTVEEIPGLMKEDKNEASEAAGEQMLNQNTVSQGNGAGSQEAPQKQYSDKGTPNNRVLKQQLYKNDNDILSFGNNKFTNTITN